MAEALVETTIPCDKCQSQIEMANWSEHVRQCHCNEKIPIDQSKRDALVELPPEGIPCEFCEVQIDLNDWQTHTKQCADEHRRQTEQSRTVDTTVLIPCEYCNSPIDVHDWEWHTRRCANNGQPNAKIPRYDNTQSREGLIPCEYCSVLVSMEDWSRHTKECAEVEKQRYETIARAIANEPDSNFIPCEYCGLMFGLELFEDHEKECRQKQAVAEFQLNSVPNAASGFPNSWDLTSPYNLSRYILEQKSKEYLEVATKFNETLPNNQIIQIERIQNRRWYRQYDAHRDDFIERYGSSTEQWLFHGCKSNSTEAIIKDCFNRGHAVRCAAGQGIYFAAQASTSLAYTQPDAGNLRHMFMARVLVGKTTGGNPAMRVCPPGFDTTGGGTIFVTYHDAQAYGEYLIIFR